LLIFVTIATLLLVIAWKRIVNIDWSSTYLRTLQTIPSTLSCANIVKGHENHSPRCNEIEKGLDISMLFE
jgi:hypothetical protein